MAGRFRTDSCVSLSFLFWSFSEAVIYQFLGQTQKFRDKFIEKITILDHNVLIFF